MKERWSLKWTLGAAAFFPHSSVYTSLGEKEFPSASDVSMANNGPKEILGLFKINRFSSYIV